MCGRFTLAADPKKISEAFEVTVTADLEPRYNIAPTQPVAVIANNNRAQVELFHWGLIPPWAKDPKIGNRMINARGETLGEKRSFKAPYKRRRCLVISDGFYEWRKNPGSKQKTPLYIKLRKDDLFAFAGLWESWSNPDGDTVLSCTIITTEPNELVADIHNRMPVILPPEAYDRWLDPAERQPAELQDLLTPYPAEAMTAYEVSTVVNNPRNDSPQCVEPVQRLL